VGLIGETFGSAGAGRVWWLSYKHTAPLGQGKKCPNVLEDLLQERRTSHAAAPLNEHPCLAQAQVQRAIRGNILFAGVEFLETAGPERIAPII